jgi:hypothetical protein
LLLEPERFDRGYAPQRRLRRQFQLGQEREQQASDHFRVASWVAAIFWRMCSPAVMTG